MRVARSSKRAGPPPFGWPTFSESWQLRNPVAFAVIESPSERSNRRLSDNVGHPIEAARVLCSVPHHDSPSPRLDMSASPTGTPLAARQATRAHPAIKPPTASTDTGGSQASVHGSAGSPTLSLATAMLLEGWTAHRSSNSGPPCRHVLLLHAGCACSNPIAVFRHLALARISSL